MPAATTRAIADPAEQFGQYATCRRDTPRTIAHQSQPVGQQFNIQSRPASVAASINRRFYHRQIGTT